jgi:predicted GIY-YIG superfamily endonuclease
MTYSEKELIDYLKRCKDKHGEVKHQTLNRDNDLPSGPLYDNRFGSLEEALQEADMDAEANKAATRSKKSKGGYSKEELLKKLKELEEKNGFVEYKQLGKNYPSKTTYQRHFGTLKKACNEANVEYKTNKKPTREKVKEELIKADKKSTTPVSYDDVAVSKNAIKNYFGGIVTARKKLGLQEFGDVELFDREYIYVIIFEKSGEQSFYIGKTENLNQRLKSHKKEGIDAAEVSGEKLSVERIIPADKFNEREVSIKIAQEYETNNIYGGR